MSKNSNHSIVREMKQCIVLLIVAVLGAQAQTSPPAIVIRPPDSSTATETQTARFTCAAYGVPTPAISWTQAQGGLAAKLDDENSGYKVYTQTLVVNGVEFAISVLEICGVSMDTADTYTCSASNGVSGTGVADKSASFSLVVTASTKQPAALVLKASDVTVDYGSNVEAVCVAYGNPLPTITWGKATCPSCTTDFLRTGSTTITNQIVNYGDVAFVKSTLNLCGVEDVDSDTFRCEAANGVAGDGIADSTGSWSLSVNPEPVMTSTSTATRGGTSSGAPVATEGATERLVVEDERAYQAVVAIETIAIVILLVVVVVLIIFIFLKSRQASQMKPDIPRPPRDPHVRKEGGFENPLHGDNDDAVDVDTMTYADLAKKLDD